MARPSHSLPLFNDPAPEPAPMPVPHKPRLGDRLFGHDWTDGEAPHRPRRRPRDLVVTDWGTRPLAPAGPRFAVEPAEADHFMLWLAVAATVAIPVLILAGVL